MKSFGLFGDVEIVGPTEAPLAQAVRRQLIRYYRAVARFESKRAPSIPLLQFLFRLVHSHTVTAAMLSAKPLVRSLPNGEREFALGWGRVMVRLLAQANFPTDRSVVSVINALALPQRVCDAADIDVARASSLPAPQRECLLAILLLYRFRFLSFFYDPFLELGAIVVSRIIELIRPRASV